MTYSNFAMPSSGDDEADRRELEEFARRQMLMDEGLCPNGCGPRAPGMVPDDDHPEDGSHCPVCGFQCNTQMPAPAGEGRCICADGTPVWCDRHGDLWYSDDGDQHYGDPPDEVAAAREADDPENSTRYPLAWQHPPMGLTVTYITDAGDLEVRGMR